MPSTGAASPEKRAARQSALCKDFATFTETGTQVTQHHSTHAPKRCGGPQDGPLSLTPLA